MLLLDQFTSTSKINLYLDIVGKDPSDGYHFIESVFYEIPWGDDFEIYSSTEDKVEFSGVSSEEIPQENTVTKALRLFKEKFDIEESYYIKIKKNVPMGAGLGGGSGNAGAVLKWLAHRFEIKIENCINIAQQVGSDVPFFLSSGAAVVTGRGEFVREIDLRTNVFFLVIQPNVHSSTKEAFKLFDNWRGNGKALKFPDLAKLESMYRMPVTNWTFRNSFTEPLAERYPPIAKALASVIQHGAMFSEMSGSGSAVYGVFCSEKDAEKAYTQLCLEWKCWLVRPYSIGLRSI